MTDLRIKDLGFLDYEEVWQSMVSSVKIENEMHLMKYGSFNIQQFIHWVTQDLI